MKPLGYIGWFFFILFAISIGLYPVLYWTMDMSAGLLSSKTAEILESKVWSAALYTHLTFGGLSLLSGWSQFSNKLRIKYLSLHRWLGKLYVLFVFFSGTAALYISFYASGGVISSLGFVGLAIAWLSTTGMAYLKIRKLEIEKHRQWMIRSYALTFAAVTLRLWIPLFQNLSSLDFISAYKITSWLCWVPNFIVAEVIIRRE